MLQIIGNDKELKKEIPYNNIPPLPISHEGLFQRYRDLVHTHAIAIIIVSYLVRTQKI